MFCSVNQECIIRSFKKKNNNNNKNYSIWNVVVAAVF